MIAQGDRDLAMQLFPAIQRMSADKNAPAEHGSLGKVLAYILIGERNPDLAVLRLELASHVRGLPGRIRAAHER